MIPKHIYQSWSTTNLHPSVQMQIDHMKALNPEYQYHLFTHEMMDNFVHQHFPGEITECYDRLTIIATKVDFWRYLLLYLQGGVYVNMDSAILRPLGELIRDEDEAIISVENNPFFCQWALIFNKGHPILKKTIEFIVRNIQTNRYPNDIHKMTGPCVFTEAVLYIHGQRHHEYNNLIELAHSNIDKTFVDPSSSSSYRIYGIDYNGFLKFKHDDLFLHLLYTNSTNSTNSEHYPKVSKDWRTEQKKVIPIQYIQHTFHLHLLFSENNPTSFLQHNESTCSIWKSIQDFDLHPHVFVVPDQNRLLWMMYLLRSFPFRNDNNHDLVCFVDPACSRQFIYSDEKQIVEKFLSLGHDIVFGVEFDASSSYSLSTMYKTYKTFFRLHPAIFMGRGIAIRQMLQDMMDKNIMDFSSYYQSSQSITDRQGINIGLDTQQMIFQTLRPIHSDLVKFHQNGCMERLNSSDRVDRVDTPSGPNVVCCVYVMVGSSDSMLLKTFENLTLLYQGLLERVQIKMDIVFVYDDFRCEKRIKNRIENYQKTRSGLHSVIILPCVGCTSNYQRERDAMVRNKYLHFLDFNSERKQYDFHFVIDVDPKKSYVMDFPWNIKIFEPYLNSMSHEYESQGDWDCISFYEPEHYEKEAMKSLFYGIFQHHYLGFHFFYHDSITHIMKKDFSMKLQEYKDRLFPCDSAFNGFALYRTQKFKNAVYDGFYNNLKKIMPENAEKNTLDTLQSTFFPFEDFYIDNTVLEHSEHVYYHVSATQNHHARIRISQEPLHDESSINDNNKSIFNHKDDEEERMCFFVSPRGLLTSCDLRPKKPCSSAESLGTYTKRLDGKYTNVMTVYVCNSPAMLEFIQEYIQKKRITYRFVLVSGDCDWTCPTELFQTHEEFLKFMETENLVHWFSQNCIGVHAKLSSIPIGLDYHTLNNREMTHEIGFSMSPLEQERILLQKMSKSTPFWKRKPLCYSNFHFAFYSTNTERFDAINQIPNELVFYEPEKVIRSESWEHQLEYAFVLSPRGNGHDCHRTWEALLLGCIPIVKTSPMDSLYDDLPVLCVSSWSDISESLLANTIEKYRHQSFSINKLTLTYWMEKIQSFTL